MQSLLQVKNASKAFGRKILFENAEFSIQEGEHLGVIGPNGAGKSTLFKIIVGEDQFDEGDVTKSRSLKIGYLSQYDDSEVGESGEQYLERMSTAPIWELKTIGASLGLHEEHFNAELKSLSGGYRMRFRLSAVLGNQPNLLLLDEPTNYLDIESVLTLERFLCGFNEAFALISHDREFLKRVTDHTLEVEAGLITKYPGNLEDYFEQKTMLEEQLKAREMNLQAKREEMESFIERFRSKASKAKQAQSRIKALEKMEVVEHRAVPKQPRIRIPEPDRISKVPIKMRDLTLGYEKEDGTKKVILNKVNLLLENKSHIGILGMNGAGKSTLLKALSGHLQPLSGELDFTIEIEDIGYYAQHVTEALEASRTVYQELSHGTDSNISPQMILDLAGSLLFQGDDVHKKISLLSGGEKSRVALGKILLKKSPILVLDEPTNHLDFQTVSALADALKQFAGVVLAVSHDRSFIARFAEQFIEVKNGQALSYKGTYEEYLWSLENQIFNDSENETQKQKAKTHSPKKNTNETTQLSEEKNISHYEMSKERERRKKKIQNDSKKAEDQMAALSKKLNQLNEDLEACGFSDLKKVNELGQTQKELSTIEELWMNLQEEFSQLQ